MVPGVRDDVTVQKIRNTAIVRRHDGTLVGIADLDPSCGEYRLRIMWPKAQTDKRRFWSEQDAIDAIVSYLPTRAQFNASGTLV